VVCVDSGYQIGVAGAAGMDVKETELLVTVPTEDEALEVIAAFVQLYRENARYLHRVYKCRDQVGDLDTRRALYDRFLLSQSVYQTDPWAEHAAVPADWAPIADLTLRAAE
jgi:nitrite reductase (NADH) large subunit